MTDRFITAGDGVTYGPFPPPAEVAATPHLTVGELVDGFASHLYARPFRLGQSMTLDYITATDNLSRVLATIRWWKEVVGGQVTAEQWPAVIGHDAHVVFTIPGVRIETVVKGVDDDPEFPWYGRLGLSAAEVRA